MKEKIPIETLLALREQGLSYRQIGAQVGMWNGSVRKRIVNYQKHGGVPQKGRPKTVRQPYTPTPIKARGPYSQIKEYKLSSEEIERRYGKPGALAESSGTAVTYGWPGGGEQHERHYARRER